MQGITTVGNSLFFLGSRLGDSLLVQFTCGLGTSIPSSGVKDEVCIKVTLIYLQGIQKMFSGGDSLLVQLLFILFFVGKLLFI